MNLRRDPWQTYQPTKGLGRRWPVWVPPLLPDSHLAGLVANQCGARPVALVSGPRHTCPTSRARPPSASGGGRAGSGTGRCRTPVGERPLGDAAPAGGVCPLVLCLLPQLGAGGVAESGVSPLPHANNQSPNCCLGIGRCCPCRKRRKTLYNGFLGSHIDEERSKAR